MRTGDIFPRQLHPRSGIVADRAGAFRFRTLTAGVLKIDTGDANHKSLPKEGWALVGAWTPAELLQGGLREIAATGRDGSASPQRRPVCEPARNQ